MTKTIQVHRTGEGAGTNAAIQRAVDAAAGGDVVEVPAGEYLMYNALHLRSGVRVVGEAGTVLKKAPSISSRIADYLGYGHYEITVADPNLFRVGMGVHVIDDQAAGFYTTAATVCACRITLSAAIAGTKARRKLKSPRDCARYMSRVTQSSRSKSRRSASAPDARKSTSMTT